MVLQYDHTEESSLFLLGNFGNGGLTPFLESGGLYKIFRNYEERPVPLLIDGCRDRLEPGQLLFCTPLNKLRLEREEPGMEALFFNREFYCIRDHDYEVSCEGFLFYGSSAPVRITLDAGSFPQFDAMFLLLKEEFRQRDYIQGEMLRTLLKRILISSRRKACEGLPKPGLGNHQYETIRTFNILVEEHFRSYHKVSDYARLLNKSPKTLSNVFKGYNELSPLQAIQQRILTEARRLLLYSARSISEIAYELGYENGHSFTQFFKKHSGKTPTAFRREAQDAMVHTREA